jgi:hypothetical protein
MKLQHLGKIVDLEPQQAALENRVVRMLNKHRSGVRERNLFFLTGSNRFGYQAFKRAINRLIDEEDVVKRVTTDHKNSFLLTLTSWGEVHALDLEETLAAGKDSVA